MRGRIYSPQPRYGSLANMIDNSNFSDPVYQAGLGGAHGDTVHAVDRWIYNGNSADLSLNAGAGISFPVGYVIFQRTKETLTDGKTRTLAICTSNGTMGCLQIGSEYAAIGNTGYAATHNGENVVYINNTYATSPIKWAALYDGIFTVDTLPPYAPRPYSTELAECQRYFERIGDAHSELLSTTTLVDGQRYAMFPIHYSPKRKTPSIVISDPSNYRVLTKGLQENMASANSIESLSAYSVMNTDATIIVKMNGGVYANNAILQRSDSATAAWIDVVADL